MTNKEYYIDKMQMDEWPIWKKGDIIDCRGSAGEKEDALMFAAAPELLEALKGIINAFTIQLKTHGDAGSGIEINKDRAVKIAYAAIARAEGK